MFAGQGIGWGMHDLWTAATAFVMLLGLMWLARFAAGAWRSIRLVEDKPVTIEP
jgi:hypothetical protein